MPHQEYIGKDGKKWPSATELIALLPKDFLWAWYKRAVEKEGWTGWLKCNSASELGRKLGTAVHGHIENWTAGKEPCNEVENSLEIAKKLHNTVKTIVDEYTEIEPHLISNKLKIHGTADLIFRRVYTPGLRVGDYKTSFQKDTYSHPIQLAIYTYCWNELHPDQLIDVGEIFRIDKRSSGLTVKIDEYKNLKQYFPVIKALRTIWGYLNV